MDDRTAGLILRALRRRRGWTQGELAARAACSQSLVSNVERGHLGGVTVDTLRALFGALDARVLVEPRWRGAELDRLLDAEHAAISAATARRLEARGWSSLHEVTYAIGGERGSIDVLGVDPARRAALVCEIKSDVPSAEATGRKLDEKRRLAPLIVQARLGWSPAAVGAVLVLPVSSRLRDLLAGPAQVLARTFPVDGRRVARWLRDPGGPMAATWFLPNITGRNGARVSRRRRGPAGVVLPPRTARAIVEDDPADPEITILR
jgi:transcriptional regulator with XRE-family HTH domain